MELVLALPPDWHPKVVSQSPTEELIVTTVESQAWDDITFVILQSDENNYFDFSGSY